ncbi:MAG: hypothetical protein HYR91_06235 [Flavobacteriia bacterium]|nr:hypothetical protein [Flavobacteriia bacterium]
MRQFSQKTDTFSKHAFNRVEKTPIKSILKFTAVISIILIVVTFLKSITTYIKNLFGGGTKTPQQQAYEQLFTNTGGSSSGAPSSGAVVPKGGKNDAPKPWRPIVDAIYDKLGGYNPMGCYPEIVNKIAHMSDEYVRKAAYYWHNKYSQGEGKSLYKFIYDEWGSQEYYLPALGKLKKLGFKS